MTSEPRQFEELVVACFCLESNPPAELSLSVLGNDNYHKLSLSFLYFISISSEIIDMAQYFLSDEIYKYIGVESVVSPSNIYRLSFSLPVQLWTGP